MKIKSVTPLNDGMERGPAEEFWRDLAGFAEYSFNKSHSAAYSLISMQTMYLKTHYPVEFWSGVLSMLKDERRDATLADMKRMGISLLPPDINVSEVVFYPLNDAIILAPFGAIKGITDRSATAIVFERTANGPFTSIADLEKRVAGRLCTSKQRDLLDKVGAFASVEPGQVASDHHSRRRDQVDLLTGLISDSVVVDRLPDLAPAAVNAISGLVNDWKACQACDLKGLCHPKPWLRSSAARFVAIVDAPGYKEEAADEMGHGGQADALREALAGANMELEDVYITALVKTPKPDKGKKFSKETLTACPQWLEKELAILKPPVIAILGSEAFYYFFKGLKGGLAEHSGRVIYDKVRDCNFLIGVNPAAIFFSPEKQNDLNAAFAKLPDLLPY